MAIWGETKHTLNGRLGQINFLPLNGIFDKSSFEIMRDFMVSYVHCYEPLENNAHLLAPIVYGKEKIASSEFANSKYTAAAIPPTVNEIGDYAFEGSDKLVIAVFPNKVDNMGKGMFKNCTSLDYVFFPPETTKIPEEMFMGTSNTFAFSSNISNITEIGAQAFESSANGIHTVIMPNLKTIGPYAFRNGAFSDAAISPTVTYIGRHAYYNCNSLSRVFIADVGAWCNIHFESIYSNPLYYANSLIIHKDGEDIVPTTIDIPDGVKTIPYYAFSVPHIETISIPETVTEIQEGAFADCEALQTVYYYGTSAQWNAINIGTNNDYLLNANIVFWAEGTQGLTYELLDDDTYSVTDYTGTETNVVIPYKYNGKYVTQVRRNAFFNCASMKSVAIPNSVTSIGESAFDGCSELTSVYITDIEAWCNIEFLVNGPSNPLYYAKNLYVNGKLLTELVIPDSVTSIGSYAFTGCTSLTSVTIPDSVTSIGEGAFWKCTSLISMTIPDSVTSIGEGAFAGCSELVSIVLGKNAEDIDKYAFHDCVYLTEVYIPRSIKHIKEAAFENCSRLETVYYEGTQEEWNAITIGDRNDKLLSATKHYNVDY